MRLIFLLVCLASVALGSQIPSTDAQYLIGAGIYDSTGPAADVNLMGYANPSQKAGGIHMRSRARAFIFAEKDTPDKRVVLINLDAGMIGQQIRQRVVPMLQKKYGDLYRADNILITGTHSHSMPAGFLQYLLFDLTSLGFVEQALDAFVNGVYNAIVRAHESLVEGHVYIVESTLNDASVNRSPTSYLLNPADERAQYDHDTDKEFTLLKLIDTKGNDIAMVNWFAVHGTSMNNTNSLLSGDNKGYAAYMTEKQKNPDNLPGTGSFVAGFLQANLGDVSPNTKGARCIDTGKPCDLLHSTCDGKNELCIASGPGKDMFDSTRIIGQKQFDMALTMYNNATEEVTGSIDVRYTTVDMSKYQVTLSDGTTVSTCPGAMGDSFAAGTTDGPGAFNFDQGNTTGNPIWDALGHLLSNPTKEQIACQHPKPILLNTGEIDIPYAWDPTIVDVQVIRIGQLIIAAPPSEFTTMSGRRTKALMRKIFGQDKHVVIAGLSNSYSSYVTTYEEYQAQRYEAASTIFGPHTLEAYLDIFGKLATSIVNNTTLPAGPPIPDLSKKQISLLPGVIDDSVPLGAHFGDVTEQVQPSYNASSSPVVSVTFRAGCPRNDLMTEKSFLSVEQQQSDGSWKTILTDGDWATRFYWYRNSSISAQSFARVEWHLDSSATPGTYRIQHFGVHKNILQKKSPYTGTSNTFVVA